MPGSQYLTINQGLFLRLDNQAWEVMEIGEGGPIEQAHILIWGLFLLKSVWSRKHFETIEHSIKASVLSPAMGVP